MKKGFTLIELLIVVAVLGILGVSVLSAINPIEMINRAKDTATLNSAAEVYEAANRSYAMKSTAPWDADIVESSLSSPVGTGVLNNLITLGEIKRSFLSTSREKLPQIYLTATSDMSFLALCFRPISTQFRNSANNIYNLRGQYVGDCSQRECYTCITNFMLAEADDYESLALNESVNVASSGGDINYCANFNPERPEFPWTCNYSDKYDQFGCTNYCVGDLGCNSGCPTGQRKLTKNYYATTKGVEGSSERIESDRLFALCLSHWREYQVDEAYCVSGEAAGCDIKPYISNPSDFEWGCTNPRRPYMWK